MLRCLFTSHIPILSRNRTLLGKPVILGCPWGRWRVRGLVRCHSPSSGFTGNWDPPICGTDLLPFSHLPPIKKSKRPVKFSACLRQLDVLLIQWGEALLLLYSWWRLDFGLSHIPGFCSVRRQKGGRMSRGGGTGNHLSCAYKSVPFVSEHAHWGTHGSHKIQPLNLNWREGKLRRWLLCYTLLCLFGSHPPWLPLHLWLYGWRWITLEKMDSIDRKPYEMGACTFS